MKLFQKIDALLVVLILGWFVSFSLLSLSEILGVSSDEQIALDLDFSEQVGFNEDVNTFELNNPANKLYYSVDGGDTFEEAEGNVFSTNELRNPNLLNYSTSSQWRPAYGDFPKMLSLVLKVQRSQDLKFSEEAHFSILEDEIDNYVSINVNQSDLLNWSSGLMISGESAAYESGFHKEWWYRNANYTQRGFEWERSVNLAIVINGIEQLNQSCGVRISGNASRHFPQKSLKFYSRKIYGDQSFDLGASQLNNEYTTLLLRNSGNDNNKTMFADAIQQSFATGTNVITQESVLMDVFFNGNYWGIYNLRERIDAKTIANKLDAKEKDITILYYEDGGFLTQRRDGKKKEQRKFENLMTEILESDEVNLTSVEEQIDLESFIDYIFFETFYANSDWLHNNVTFCKEKGKRWNWILNDLDCGMAYSSLSRHEYNMFEQIENDNSTTAKLFTKLLSSEKFKSSFIKRADLLIESNFSEENIDAQFDQYQSKYETKIERQIRRWRFISSTNQWQQDCSNNRNFLKERKSVYLKQLSEL
jgi:plasmid maintenance system killer protein